MDVDSGTSPAHPARSRHQRAFRLAYAVLHHQPIGNVFEGTRLLVEALENATGAMTNRRSIFEREITLLLGDELRPDRLALRTAELRNENFIDALLDVAWHDYDTAREPLLKWLDCLARRPEQSFILAAAVTAGRLLAYDFEHVCERLVDPWARDGATSIRQVAALTCEFASLNQNLKEAVRGHVAGWAWSRLIRQQDCALRVHATSFGSRFPADAMQDLQQIAADPEHRSNTIVSAVADTLFTSGPDEIVFDSILSWSTDSERPHKQLHAARAFVRIAQRINENPNELTYGETWPAILVSVDAGMRIERVGTLWRSALAFPQTAFDGWNVFALWIGRTREQPHFTEAVSRSVEIIAASRPLRARAQFQFDRVWRPLLRDRTLVTELSRLLDHDD